jgi:hypothetical protein
MRTLTIWALVVIARVAVATPILTTTEPKEVTKKEAVVTLLKGGHVYKCQEQLLTDKVTIKTKTAEDKQ